MLDPAAVPQSNRPPNEGKVIICGAGFQPAFESLHNNDCGKAAAMAIGLAFKLFFRALFDKSFRQRVRPVLEQEAAAPAALVPPAPPPTVPARSEALTLLSVL